MACGGGRLAALVDTEVAGSMDDLKTLIGKVATGAALSRAEAANAFDRMMSGEATPSQMGGLLMALRVRGETVDEITGAVSAMRSRTVRKKYACSTYSSRSRIGAVGITPRIPGPARPVGFVGSVLR